MGGLAALRPLRRRADADHERVVDVRQPQPRAKLVCIDLQPYQTVQAVDTGRNDVLNIGGFSDQVFDLIAEFAKGTLGSDQWVGVIENVSL